MSIQIFDELFYIKIYIIVEVFTKYVTTPTVNAANPIMTRRPNTIEIYHSAPKSGKFEYFLFG